MRDSVKDIKLIKKAGKHKISMKINEVFSKQISQYASIFTQNEDGKNTELYIYSMLLMLNTKMSERILDRDIDKPVLLNTLYQRVLYLLNAHELNYRQMLVMLEPYGITLNILADEGKMNPFITPELIEFLALRFNVLPGWIRGETAKLKESNENVKAVNQINAIEFAKQYLRSYILEEMPMLCVITDEKGANNNDEEAYFQLYLSRHKPLAKQVYHEGVFLQKSELQLFDCIGKFYYNDEKARRAFKYVLLIHEAIYGNLSRIDSLIMHSSVLRQLDEEQQIVNSHIQRLRSIRIVSLNQNQPKENYRSKAPKIISLMTTPFSGPLTWHSVMKKIEYFLIEGLSGTEHQENKEIKQRFNDSNIRQVIQEVKEVHGKQRAGVHKLNDLFKHIELQ